MTYCYFNDVMCILRRLLHLGRTRSRHPRFFRVTWKSSQTLHALFRVQRPIWGDFIDIGNNCGKIKHYCTIVKVDSGYFHACIWGPKWLHVYVEVTISNQVFVLFRTEQKWSPIARLLHQMHPLTATSSCFCVSHKDDWRKKRPRLSVTLVPIVQKTSPIRECLARMRSIIVLL